MTSRKIALTALALALGAEALALPKRRLADCEDDSDWRYKGKGEGKRLMKCKWIGKDSQTRCKYVGTDGSAASASCPESCGTCQDQCVEGVEALTAEVAGLKTAIQTQNEKVTSLETLLQTQSEKIEAQNFLQTLLLYRVLGGNPPLPQIIECMQRDDIAAGEHCGTCCPACTAVDTSSFASHFDGLSLYSPTDTSRCICLDLDDTVAYKAIDLTSFSDCARITGDRNFVYGMDGDDAMYTNGVGNALRGDFGDDHVAASGSGNLLVGGQDNDVCTDLGDNQFRNVLFPTSAHICESCFGPAGEELNCATGLPIRRKLTHTPACFSADATVQLADGTTKPMREIQLGDEVLDADGKYSPVYAFAHAEKDVAATFVELALETGHKMALTPDHYVPVDGRLVYARDIRPGDKVSYVADGVESGGVAFAAGLESCSGAASAGLESSTAAASAGLKFIGAAASAGSESCSGPASSGLKFIGAAAAASPPASPKIVEGVVVSTTKVTKRGLYHPYTLSGTIVVDGVVASCHSAWFLDGVLPPRVAAPLYQAVLGAGRLAHAGLGPVFEALGVGNELSRAAAALVAVLGLALGAVGVIKTLKTLPGGAAAVGLEVVSRRTSA